MQFKNTRYFIILVFLTIPDIAYANGTHSPALSGFIGLNTVPSARMDKQGTIRAGVSTLDPYMHGYIGVQIAEPLHITLRQNAEISSITKDAKRLYPSIDTKLRLIKESSYRPEISIGLQSMIGHKKMAGEYIALSKAYKNFDFTAGIGWGSMGASSKFNNPLKYISRHFDKNREPNSETPNSPANWFSGDSIGFFGGIEYFTKFDGLSLKLDYGANDYYIPQNNPPAPWSVGLSYTHNGWISASIGTQGTDKIFAGLSLQSSPDKWLFSHRKYEKPKPFYKVRSQNTNKAAIKSDALNDGIDLYNIFIKGNKIFADLKLSPTASTPKQIGRAARHISMHSAENIEEINLRPNHTNLYSANIKIMRKDVENSVGNNGGSPQEIWENASFVVRDTSGAAQHRFSSTKWINNKKSFSMQLENHLSLSEEDSGILYRSSALLGVKSSPFLGLITGSTLRINLTDNLDKIESLRPATLNPVRSDIHKFTKKRLNIDSSYIGYTHSFTPELHTAIMAGYLEEFYAGYGGEILYRPFASRLAIGAEIWNVARRSPYSVFNMELQGDSIISGHIKGWYDLPRQDITINAKIGRFLAGDVGITLGLEKIFKNGAKLSAGASLSNYSEPDLFGGTTSAHNSLTLTLPLGSIPYIPEKSNISTKISPFGRDIGQSLNAPLQLFDITENLTLDHMANYWLEIMD